MLNDIQKAGLQKTFIVLIFFLSKLQALRAQPGDTLYSYRLLSDVTVTIDRTMASFHSGRPFILVIYALPNGNTTAQTMGKRMQPGDDWHYGIQYIRAQTDFVRRQLPNRNIVVAYLENDYKSWPTWKQKHPQYGDTLTLLADSIASPFHRPFIYLNSHSGGGSFIFGYLKGVRVIPNQVRRISFIDSDYGYDSTYTDQLHAWLRNKHHYLSVFAYNDSVALYNAKPVVSATGGTWYRSHMMLTHLSSWYRFRTIENDSLVIVKSSNDRIQFYFKLNPGRKIFHTQQVELNGFIHSILCGTKKDSKAYQYYGKRAYDSFLRDQ